MSRWAAAGAYAAQARGKMVDPIREEMNRRLKERDAAMYSFDSPEPVHPRSPLPVQHNLSQSQFRPLFKTAQGIMDEYQGLSGDRRHVPTGEGIKTRPETHAEFWGRKYDEIAGGQVAESLDRTGVRNPISLRAPGTAGPVPSERPEILGGHHRVAYMQRHQPHRLIPVRFFATSGQARDVLGGQY